MAPGEIISVFGAGLGPANGVGAVVDSQGRIPTTLASVTLTFDGVPAPILYAQANQINAIVPFEVSGKQTTQLQLKYQGASSNVAALLVTDSAPGIFTMGVFGSGQCATGIQSGRHSKLVFQSGFEGIHRQCLGHWAGTSGCILFRWTDRCRTTRQTCDSGRGVHLCRTTGRPVHRTSTGTGGGCDSIERGGSTGCSLRTLRADLHRQRVSGCNYRHPVRLESACRSTPRPAIFLNLFLHADRERSDKTGFRFINMKASSNRRDAVTRGDRADLLTVSSSMGGVLR